MRLTGSGDHDQWKTSEPGDKIDPGALGSAIAYMTVPPRPSPLRKHSMLTYVSHDVGCIRAAVEMQL